MGRPPEATTRRPKSRNHETTSLMRKRLLENESGFRVIDTCTGSHVLRVAQHVRTLPLPLSTGLEYQAGRAVRALAATVGVPTTAVCHCRQYVFHVAQQGGWPQVVQWPAICSFPFCFCLHGAS